MHLTRERDGRSSLIESKVLCPLPSVYTFSAVARGSSNIFSSAEILGLTKNGDTSLCKCLLSFQRDVSQIISICVSLLRHTGISCPYIASNSHSSPKHTYSWFMNRLYVELVTCYSGLWLRVLSPAPFLPWFRFPRCFYSIRPIFPPGKASEWSKDQL